VPRCVGVRELELVVDLSAENGDAAWGFDPQLHPFTIDSQNSNRDVFAEKEALLALSAQNEHA